MTVKQVAALLGISEGRVRQLLTTPGMLKGSKPGRDWQIEEAEARRFKRVPRPPHRPPHRDGY